MKLYSNIGGFRTNKILTTACLSEISLEFCPVDINTIRDPNFLQKNPSGKVPVLETKQGVLTESNAIVRYLARANKSKPLYGSTQFEQGLVDQWLDWSVLELEPPVVTVLLPVLGWLEFEPEKNKKALADLLPTLKLLENHIENGKRQFVVGNSITIADIAIASALVLPFKFIWDEKFRKTIPAVTSWFEGLAKLPVFEKVWGNVRLCQKQMEPVAFDKLMQIDSEKKKDHKKKESKALGQQKIEKMKKVEEEQKVEMKKREKEEDGVKEEDSNDNEATNANSIPNPSSNSKFDLYNFKTLFVNSTDKQKDLQFFFDNFDPEGYSIYFVQYQKAAGEGEKLFMTSNLASGTLQKLDHFRKNAFGVHGVYGEEPNLEIRGVWLWKGIGLAKEITEMDSYEYHNWYKLDHKKEEDRKKIEEFWLGLDEGSVVDGLIAKDVRYFK